MKKQPWVSFMLAGVSLNEFGLQIPSPFVSLQLNNSQITSFTSWTLNVTVGGDASRKVNVSAFEALLYSAAQAASGYADSSGIPVSFMFGWLDENGNVSDYISYQGFTLKFTVTTSGLFMNYKIEGYASLALQSSMPVLRIPRVCGFVQPSAVVEGLAKAVKADNYYQLDIDHNDAPTLIEHGELTTSFISYVRGTYTGEDDYDTFPGLLKLSKAYNATRTAAGLIFTPGSVRPLRLGMLMNNLVVTNVSRFLKKSLTDETPQCSSFSFWIDEPTMTSPGTIHYKSNANLMTSQNNDTLEYGTSNTNIISIDGSYNGVAYNMTDMNFKSVGFAVDGSGNTIVQNEEVVNSWSASLSDVFQSANIINDINALASQFSGDFTITIPGSTKQYSVAQPISLIVMSGNTLSPISGVYNIVSVTHDIGNTFITTLKVQRLVMSSANQVATSQGIYSSGSSNVYGSNTYGQTKNIVSTGKVDFGTLYPNFTHLGRALQL